MLFHNDQNNDNCVVHDNEQAANDNDNDHNDNDHKQYD